MTEAKKATAKKAAPPRPKPVPDLTAKVGTTVELDVEDSVTSVTVTRPDGTEVTVHAAGGRALYVLDQVGVHVAGGLVVDAKG